MDIFRSQAQVYRKTKHLKEAALVLRKNINVWSLYSGFLVHDLSSNNCVLSLLQCTILRMYIYANFPFCRRDESKTSFSLQKGTFVYSRVFV